MQLRNNRKKILLTYPGLDNLRNQRNGNYPCTQYKGNCRHVPAIEIEFNQARDPHFLTVQEIHTKDEKKTAEEYHTEEK